MTLSKSSIRPDYLRWIISSLVLAPSLAAMADGTVPAQGTGGLPAISNGHGIPVIDIVPPNDQGLSHNQFIDFNVATGGAVINNSLQAGDSVLAGTLQANPQFQGHAASTILNEVIGASASNILGPQEIFGQAADYVLANPNGITVNGASFINTNRATFLVGTPEIQDGQIKSLSSLHSQGRLDVGNAGVIQVGGALDLLAPYIETHGEVSATGEMNVILGNNRIAADRHTVLETAASSPSRPPLDAHLLGAMKAGRIRIVSTTNGAGVRLPQQMLTREGFSVRSAGSIDVAGAASRPASMQGGSGDVVLDAAQDLSLVAVAIEGRDIRGSAGRNLRLDTATATGLSKQNEQWNKKAWFIPTEEYSRDRLDTTTTHTRTRAVAQRDVVLTAKDQVTLSGAEVKSAGKLAVTAGGDLIIDGVVEQKRVDETTRHRKHLWRGDSDRHEVTETAKGSRLEGGEINLAGGDSVIINGSSVRSEGALTVKAGGKILVDSIELKDSLDHREYRGDLVGGTFFGKQTDGDKTQGRTQGSELIANGDQHLTAEHDITFIGSSASAGQTLHAEAKGDVALLAAGSQGQDNSAMAEQGLTASTGQTKTAQDSKPGSKQYVAEVGYQANRSSQAHESLRHLPSELKGGLVKVNSDSLITLEGSTITSGAGDTEIAAPTVKLLAADDRENHTTRRRESGGSLQVSGGIDRLGTAFKGSSESTIETRNGTTAKVSRIDSAGEVRIDTQDYETQGAQVKSRSLTRIVADTVQHRPATDTVETANVQTGGKGTLGASLEYRDLTRPIEKLVTGAEQVRFQQPNVEDALAPPSLGADLDVGYLSRRELVVERTPQVTQYESPALELKVSGVLTDEATGYNSTEATLKIEAGKHDVLAVNKTRESTIKRTEVDAGLRVDSNTGADLNVRLSGTGGSIDRHETDTRAVVGSLSGKTGIQVQLGADGRYEGTRFNGGGGDVLVRAAGNLTVDQADNRQVTDETLIDGSAWAKAGNSPAAGKSFGASGTGTYMTGKKVDSQAVAAQIDTKGEVLFDAGGDLRVTGARIGSTAQPVTSIRMSANGLNQVLAGADTHIATGKTYGGGLQPNLGQSSTGKSGGLGGHLELASTDETSRTLNGAQLHAAGAIVIASNSRDPKAIHLQGLNAQGAQLTLSTPRGGQVIEAATSTEQRNNQGLSIGTGLNASRNADIALDTSAIRGRAQLKIDRLDSQTHVNSELRADRSLNTDSALDVEVAGAQLIGDKVAGSIGGELRVSSLQDQVSGVDVDVDARLSGEKNPEGLINGVSAFAGPAAAKVKENAGRQIKLLDTGLTPNLQVKVVRQDKTHVAQPSIIKGREGIDLQVGGDTKLTGATLESANGQVKLGNGSIGLTSLSGSDYRAEALIDLSNEPVDLVQGILDATQRKASGETAIDLGLIRAGGHDRQQTVESAVKQTKG